MKHHPIILFMNNLTFKELLKIVQGLAFHDKHNVRTNQITACCNSFSSFNNKVVSEKNCQQHTLYTISILM